MTDLIDEKPLFIPLCAEYYDAFEREEKDTEYRLEGPRWNLKTCRQGRNATLSRGYGKKNRMQRKIKRADVVKLSSLPYRLQASLMMIFSLPVGDNRNIIAIHMPTGKEERPNNGFIGL